MDALFSVIETYRWAIAGTLIMTFLGAYLVALNNRRNRFAVASEKFRNTVLSELEGLYRSPSRWPSEKFQIKRILEDKFPKLEVAVTEFRCYLNWFDRKRFDAAWLNYYKDGYYEYLPLKESGYEKKGEIVYSVDTTLTYLDNFKKNVDDLLKFAKQL
jgi:hypothetical protein